MRDSAPKSPAETIRDSPEHEASQSSLARRIGTFLRSSWAFLLPFALWLFLAGVLAAVTGKGELHLTLNTLNTWGGDTFYTWVTWLGDRRVAWLAGIALCFKAVRRGGAVLVAAIGAGLSTEFFKYVVFGPVPRPLAYFDQPTPLYLVPGFENKLDFSMPSGHAAIALAWLASLAFQSRSRLTQLALAVVAICTAYSRVFLSEHFMEDIVAGALLGVAWALMAYGLLRPDAPRNSAAAKGKN